MAAPPPKTTSQGPKPTTAPIITTKPPIVPSKPITTTNKPPVITEPPVVPTLTNSIITVAPTTATTKPPPTFTGGSIFTVGPSTKSTTISGHGGGNNINNRGQGGANSSGGDGEGMSAAAIGGLVAGLAIVLVGSVVGGFMLLKQRRKRMMFVGLGTSAAGSSSRYGGGDGYPDPPDLPRPPRAGFHQEGRPGSGTWSARSGYSGGGPPSSTGRRPYLNNHSDVFDEKGYHAEAAGLGGARMSVMGGGGLGGGSGSGYSNNVSGESFTQLHDGRFVANGRRGDSSPGGFNGVPGDVDNYPYDAQEYDARLHNKEMSSSAAFLPSPPSSPDGPHPLEGISPTESTGSSSARFQDTAGPTGQSSSPPLIGVVGPGSMGGGLNPRASGYYEGYNHVPLRSPSRTNMNMNGPPPSPHNPPMSPNGNFVNRSASRVSASIPYAPDGLPLFPPRPTSQYQHANYQQQHSGHQQQQYYGSPRSPPPQHMGGGGPPGNGYYSPRLGAQYNHHGGGGGPNFPPSPHPYQQQQQQQQQRYLQQPHQQHLSSGPMSPMTSSSITAYDHDDTHHSPQKYLSDEAAGFEKHQVYEEIYVHPQEASTASAGAPQALPTDKPAQDVAAPASGAANPIVEASGGHDVSEPTDLATLSPVVPKAASSPSPPPVPLSTKPSVGHMSLS